MSLSHILSEILSLKWLHEAYSILKAENNLKKKDSALGMIIEAMKMRARGQS